MPSVMFVSPSAYTLSGLATWLDYLLPGLDGLGWETRLCLVSGPRHHRPQAYLDVHPYARVDIAHCRTGTPEGRSRALLDALERRRPDIVVSVNVPDVYPAVNRMRGADGKAPHVAMSVHGIEAFLYADAAAYRDAIDAVICTNRLACALTHALAGVARERILYSAYAVDQAPDDRVGSTEDGLRIVYSGRLESSQKRVSDLVGIARALESRGVPYRLDIAGDGPERDALRSALDPELRMGKVRFHGQVSIDRLKREIYPSAHAMVITSSWETGPIVAWEAMAQGLPVVSSRYVGCGLEGALVDGDNALLFDIGDTAAAAAALEALWRNPELRRHLSVSARTLVEHRYSIPVSVRSWSDSLHRVLAQPPRTVASLPKPASGGRLDRWLGTGRAEWLREWSGRRMPEAADAGGEWPHALSSARSDATFWELARAVDSSNPAPPEERAAGCG